MEEQFDNPFDNPMFCGRLGGLDAYLAGGEEDPTLLLCDPTGLDPTHSPINIINKVIEADQARHMQRAKPSEEDEESG